MAATASYPYLATEHNQGEPMTTARIIGPETISWDPELPLLPVAALLVAASNMLGQAGDLAQPMCLTVHDFRLITMQFALSSRCSLVPGPRNCGPSPGRM